jgi:hypothetical protein
MTTRPAPAPRLLLASYDEIRVLWDAIGHYRLFLGGDPGDPDLEIATLLNERLGDLLAVEYDRLVGGTTDP